MSSILPLFRAISMAQSILTSKFNIFNPVRSTFTVYILASGKLQMSDIG